MDEAKKLYDDKPEMNVSKIKLDKRRLENRIISDYKSVAIASIHQADTVALETLIEEMRNDEFSQDSVIGTILINASSMLEQMGYTNNIVQSRSKRKLKKQKSSLEQSISVTNEQLANLNLTMSQIDNDLMEHISNLKEYKLDLSQKSADLKVFEKEIIDYRDDTKNSLEPEINMYLQQADLKYQIDSDIVKGLQENCDISFLSIQELYSQKSYDLANKSMFEGNKILLQSSVDKVLLALQRATIVHPMHALSSTRKTITSSYKLQEELIDKDNKWTSMYNAAVASLPSYKKMSNTIVQKRVNLPLIKR